MTTDTQEGRIEDYTWKGDTWMVVEGECLECGSSITGNGHVRACPKCDWWEKVEQTAQRA